MYKQAVLNQLIKIAADDILAVDKKDIEKNIDKAVDKIKDKLNTFDYFKNRHDTGKALAEGYNGRLTEKDNLMVNAPHATTKSKNRQLAAIGIQGAGALSGAGLGFAASKWLAGKLGADPTKKYKNKRYIRKLLGALGIGAATLAGGYGGLTLGRVGSGYLSGASKKEHQLSSYFTNQDRKDFAHKKIEAIGELLGSPRNKINNALESYDKVILPIKEI